jgi:hypothetical protein
MPRFRRLYGPTEAAINKTWKSGDIEREKRGQPLSAGRELSDEPTASLGDVPVPEQEEGFADPSDPVR